MKPRVLRALARGGCVGRRPNGDWSVWRSTDRRGAVIADMDAANVEELLLSGDLKPMGDDEDAALIWCGAALPAADIGASAQALIGDVERRSRPQSLLQRVLSQVSEESQRRRLRQVAQDFAGDFERAQTSGAASGMNWQALAAGTRIDGGPVRDQSARIGYAGQAAARVAAVMERFDRDTFRFLERMVVYRETRYAIVKWRGLRSAEVEHEGLRILRKLARLYDDVLMPVSRD